MGFPAFGRPAPASGWCQARGRWQSPSSLSCPARARGRCSGHRLHPVWCTRQRCPRTRCQDRTRSHGGSVSDQEETDSQSAPMRLHDPKSVFYSLFPHSIALAHCSCLSASPSAYVCHPLSLLPASVFLQGLMIPPLSPTPILLRIGPWVHGNLSISAASLDSFPPPGHLPGCVPPTPHHHVRCPESLSHVPHCSPGTTSTTPRKPSSSPAWESLRPDVCPAPVCPRHPGRRGLQAHQQGWE